MNLKKLEEKILEIIIPITTYLSYFLGKFSRRLKLERFSKEKKQEIFLVEQNQGWFSTGQKQVFVIFLGVLFVLGIFVYGGGLDKTDYYFKCPNTFKTDKEYTTSLSLWINHYTKEHPKATEDEIIEARKVLMKENNCAVSKFVTEESSEEVAKPEDRDISDNFPVKKFNLYGGEFNLNSVTFPEDGGIWMALFSKKLQEGEDRVDVYFSFYLKGIYKDNVSAKEEFNLFLTREKGNLLTKPFSIIESHQKEPAYFVVSHIICPEIENCGYISIIKFSSVGDNVYSVMYFKKIEMIKGKNLKESAMVWLNKNLKIDTSSYTFEQLDSIKIDDAVFNYLISKSK